MQQDAILNCLEDADISIRLLALELSAKMIDSNTLQPVVNRLISQLRGTPFSMQKSSMDVEWLTAVNSATPPECGDPKEHNNSKYLQQGRISSLPIDYRIEVLHRILDLCSFNNYSELPDFEWYVEVLVQLVKLLPSDVRNYSLRPAAHEEPMHEFKTDIASRIGSEIRNIAVRVQNVRMKTTRVAETLVLVDNREAWLPVNSSNGILGPLAWVVGEYAEYLLYPSRALESLIDTSNVSLPARTLSLYIQAIPKVFIYAYGAQSWDLTRKTEATLQLTRVIEFLEALSAHPDLDVQERAIEFLEVLRLAVDAIQSSTYQEIPFLLSAVIPSLFSGLQLNPVAASAQRKVPLPERLTLEKILVGNFRSLFKCDDWTHDLQGQDPSKRFYYVREVPVLEAGNIEFGQLDMQPGASYQDPGELIGDVRVTKRKAERAERNKDDPFYIGVEERPSGKFTPLHEAPDTMHREINIDAIPVVDLKLDDTDVTPTGPLEDYRSDTKNTSRSKKPHIIADETIGYEEPSSTSICVENIESLRKSKNSLLQVDSSGLGHFPLEAGNAPGPDVPQYLAKAGGDEAEMARAMHNVEKARLEMQRASERTYLGGVPAEGMLVSKKKGRKPVTQKTIRSD